MTPADVIGNKLFRTTQESKEGTLFKTNSAHLVFLQLLNSVLIVQHITEQLERFVHNMTDLLDIIEWSCVECLNQNPSRNIGNALKQVSTLKRAIYLIS